MKKPRVLVFPFDLLSHYTRCLEIAEELKDDYDVQFKASEKYAAFIEGAGFQVFHCDEFDAGKVLECSQRFDFSWLNQKDLERIFLSQVNILRALKPAFVIGDMATTLAMAAKFTNTPFVSVINAYMSKFYKFCRNVPPSHVGHQYLKLLPEKVAEGITRMAERSAMGRVQEPFNNIRKKYNLPLNKIYLDELEGDLTLLCDLPELFPQKKLPSKMAFFRPLYFKNSAQAEEEAINFIHSRPGKKNILISFGSTGDFNKIAFIKSAVFSDFNFIISGNYPDGLSGVNVFCRRFINNCSILPSIALMICHGGNGTIYQALSYGVPVLAVPVIFEQYWNVEALKRLGLGEELILKEGLSGIKKQIEKAISLKGNEKLTQIKGVLGSRAMTNPLMDFLKYHIKEKSSERHALQRI
jgi:UDP:flavonoid glycosyltransferase YjiC (YdhE family)